MQAAEITLGSDGMVPFAAEWRHLGDRRAQRAFCLWWPWPLTFDLDSQTRPSEKPNTTSVRIWRKSVQQFATYLRHRQKVIDGAKNRTLPCVNYTDTARPYLPSSALHKTHCFWRLLCTISIGYQFGSESFSKRLSLYGQELIRRWDSERELFTTSYMYRPAPTPIEPTS